MNSTELAEYFAVGDSVVYPSQGIGCIEGREIRNDKEYLRIHLNSSNMDVLLPIVKAEELGLRHLSSIDDTNKALDSLSTKQKTSNLDWKTRLQENQNLLKSGSLISVASVVNSLYRRSKVKELPSMERKIFDYALSMLVDESSSVLGINIEKMKEKIFSKLEA